MPGEGDEPLTEEEKTILGLKSKFVQATRTFHAPDLAAQHRAKMDRLNKADIRSGKDDRAASAMGSSNKDTSIKDDKSTTVAKEYFPLAPEQWREKIREFK